MDNFYNESLNKSVNQFYQACILSFFHREILMSNDFRVRAWLLMLEMTINKDQILALLKTMFLILDRGPFQVL